MAARRTTSPPPVDDRGDLRPIAWAISGVVGLFVVVVAAAWVWSHVVRGDPLDAVALIILGATLLRIGTLLVAWAAVCRWGRRLPQGPLVGALWGCALAQLVYPVAELVVKLLVLTRIVPSGTGGVRNMSAVGWGNFAAAAVVFGVPGALFAVLGHRVRVRRQVPARWAWIGGAGGVVALGLIGVAIGS